MSAPKTGTGPAAIPRTILEGLVAGGFVGAVLLLFERSPTFNVFADVLNVMFRLAADRFPESLLIRLDTEAVAWVLYAGGHALLGGAIGAALAAASRRTPTALRRLFLVLVLFGVDALGFGAVWRHRGLSPVLGAGLLGVAAMAGYGGATVFGAALARLLPRPVTRGLAFVLPLAIVAAGATVLFSAASGPSRPEGRTVDYPRREPTGTRVAILGIDGLDGFLVDEALRAGRMPTLARLHREGVRGDLRSIRPPKSPVVCTSIATGTLPSVHRITDFVVRRKGRQIPVTSNMRRSPALWNMARTSGFDVAFVNWYVTWPAEEVPGVMVSDRVDFDGLADRVYPPEFLPRVEAARARVETRTDRSIGRFTDLGSAFPDWRAARWGQVRRALSILDDVVRHDLVTLECSREALADGQPDVSAFYFRGNDNTQHLFWKYRLAERSNEGLADLLYDELSPRDIAALAAVVDRYYDFIDDLIAEAIDMLDPDTAILILSDHGFLTNNERSRWWNVNPLLEAAELCTLLPGGGGAADPGQSEIVDSEPPSVDARRTLRPGAASERPDESLARAEAVLRDSRTDVGEPVFRRIERGQDDDGPFLTIVFAEELRGERVTAAGREIDRTEITVPEGHSGDHRMNGFMLVAGPPFRRGVTYEGARALDITPTVLHLVGSPAARDMEGVVLEGLLDPEWAAAHPVRYVDSYGTREGIESTAIETGADDKIREELRALGYIQ